MIFLPEAAIHQSQVSFDQLSLLSLFGKAENSEVIPSPWEERGYGLPAGACKLFVKPSLPVE